MRDRCERVLHPAHGMDGWMTGVRSWGLLRVRLSRPCCCPPWSSLRRPPEISGISTSAMGFAFATSAVRTDKPVVQQCHVVLRLGPPSSTRPSCAVVSARLRRIYNTPTPQWIRNGKCDLTRRALDGGGDLHLGWPRSPSVSVGASGCVAQVLYVDRRFERTRQEE